MKITRCITAFEGHSLIVGCGSNHHHQFSLKGQKIHSENLHPDNLYYTLDLDSSHTPDLAADFLSVETLNYLAQKKFAFICFEVTTGLFSNEEELTEVLKKAKSLLTENGILFLFKCSRDPLDQYTDVLSQEFQYGYTIESGLLNIWSALISNAPFSLEEIRQKYTYCDALLETHQTNICITELQAKILPDSCCQASFWNSDVSSSHHHSSNSCSTK